jgi:hypothetical protein
LNKERVAKARQEMIDTEASVIEPTWSSVFCRFAAFCAVVGAADDDDDTGRCRFLEVTPSFSDNFLAAASSARRFL